MLRHLHFPYAGQWLCLPCGDATVGYLHTGAVNASLPDVDDVAGDVAGDVVRGHGAMTSCAADRPGRARAVRMILRKTFSGAAGWIQR